MGSSVINRPTQRFKPGRLLPRITLAGGSIRTVCQDTGLNFRAVQAAVEGRDIRSSTFARIAAWLRQHPPVLTGADADDLLGADL